MKKIEDFDFQDKRVFLRAGFDVPIFKGKITDDFRIRMGLPTINYLLNQGAKLIIGFHIGRKGDLKNPAVSVKPVVRKLSELLEREIGFVSDCVSREAKEKAESLKEGDIIVLENLRFHLEEEKNDLEFAKKLASLAEVFIEDAFSALHREHASIVGIPKLLQSFPGMLVRKEEEILKLISENPAKPAIAIIGGAKAESKIPTIENLIKNGYSKIFFGGEIANNFLAAKGIDIKNSVLDQDCFNLVKLLLQNYSDKIVLPCDYLWNENNQIFDIGGETIKIAKEIIQEAKTILWNGPMGVFEEEQFSEGTREIGKAIGESKAYKVSGGGDTTAALRKFNLLDDFDFNSTGGSVTLEFLAGKKLPGLEVLE